MNSRNDKVKGAINSSVGRIKQATGRVTNDKKLEGKGLIQEDKGKGQQMRGSIKESIQKNTRLVGDAIDKVGRKIKHLAD